MKHSLKTAAAHGFTLIELIIAIAILAIIIGIAIPSYTQYVLKSGRADAKNALMQSAQSLERCYTRFSAYNDSDCNANKAAPTGIDGMMSENDKYQLSITSISPNAFTLRAVPQGGQTNDSECGNFTLTNTGQKGANGGTDAADVDKCW